MTMLPTQSKHKRKKYHSVSVEWMQASVSFEFIALVSYQDRDGNTFLRHFDLRSRKIVHKYGDLKGVPKYLLVAIFEKLKANYLDGTLRFLNATSTKEHPKWLNEARQKRLDAIFDVGD